MRNDMCDIDTMQAGKVLGYRRPDAFAHIQGDCEHEELYGCVCFYELGDAVLVAADIHGLPETGDNCGRFREIPQECGNRFYGIKRCTGGIHAMHIHAGDSCSGNSEDAFADTNGHFDMNNCPHPYHSGDMPPLFSNNGRAWCAFIVSGFNICQIIGKTVVIHEGPDDFTSQPAGNSGKKIGCGVICKNF